MNDDGKGLIDPHDMDFYKEVKASQTPGGNLRFYRRLVRMTQPELAAELRTSKQGECNSFCGHSLSAKSEEGK